MVLVDGREAERYIDRRSSSVQIAPFPEIAMRARKLLLRVYGERSGGQWSLVSLDFALAAQADTLEEAKTLLESQIAEYVTDALVGDDKAHAEELLSRRAPLKYWVKYGIARIIQKINGSKNGDRAFKETMPLVPAHA